MTEVIFRLVSDDDAPLLFEWRNDEETRRQSGTTAAVEMEGHVKWLTASLKNPNRILVIGEIDGDPIGTARADHRDDVVSEISYTVAPSMRGKGLSKPMVLGFVKEFLEGRSIIAEIKKGNVASESIAKTLGLSPHHETASSDPNDPRPMVEWR